MHPEFTLNTPAMPALVRADGNVFARRAGAMAAISRGIVGPH
jgi:hypothetical protein